MEASSLEILAKAAEDGSCLTQFMLYSDLGREPPESNPPLDIRRKLHLLRPIVMHFLKDVH